MARRPKRTFMEDFKRFFVRGLGIVLPTALTLWILVQAYIFVESNIGEPINQLIRFAVIQTLPRVVDDEHLPEWFVVGRQAMEQERNARRDTNLPELSEERLRQQLRGRAFKTWWDERWYLRMLGVGVAILLIYLAGVMLGGFIGRRIYARAEEFITRLPLFKQVYPSVKRVVEFLFGESDIRFNRVVLVEYPRRGLWSIGLVTGPPMKAAARVTQTKLLTVFIPSSPTPFTGYTITVPESDVIELGISIDEALRFTVSGGVLLPESQQDPKARSMLDPTGSSAPPAAPSPASQDDAASAPKSDPPNADA
jgi:uncharacterized membrane protein